MSLEELRAIIRDEGGRLLNNQLVLQQIQQQQMLQNIPRLHQQPFLQQNAQQRQWQQPPLQLRQAPQLLPQPQLLPPQQREREAGEAPEVVYVREGTPPLEACSPGNGDWKGQVTHLCGHVSNKVASSQALQEAFADYKFGKVLQCCKLCSFIYPSTLPSIYSSTLSLHPSIHSSISSIHPLIRLIHPSTLPFHPSIHSSV